jgi:hypothetical protein
MKCERKLEIAVEEVGAAAKTEDLMIGTQIENYILFSCLCSTLKKYISDVKREVRRWRFMSRNKKTSLESVSIMFHDYGIANLQIK